MPKQITEMLKDARGRRARDLAGRAAYGYEITAWLREQGFTEIAEGTRYAPLLLRMEQRKLVDIEKVPSEKGPPRKVYSLNAAGREYLDEFWNNWGFLADRLEQLRKEGNWTWRRTSSSSSSARSTTKKQWRAYKARVKALPDDYRTAVDAIERYLMHSRHPRRLDARGRHVRRARRPVRAGGGRRQARARHRGRRPARLRRRAFVATYSDGGWIAKERERLRAAITLDS